MISSGYRVEVACTGEEAKEKGLVDELGGYDVALRLAKEAAKIEDKWKELLAYAGYKADADYTICFPSTVLQTFADDAFAGYRGLNCKPSAPATGSTIHNLLNESWDRFWSAPDKFAAWEKGKVASVLAKP